MAQRQHQYLLHIPETVWKQFTRVRAARGRPSARYVLEQLMRRYVESPEAMFPGLDKEWNEATGRKAD
jgi:hypothetical protein